MPVHSAVDVEEAKLGLEGQVSHDVILVAPEPIYHGQPLRLQRGRKIQIYILVAPEPR